VYWTASDASGKPEPISGAVGIPTSWTPDGNTLLYTHFAADKRPQIWRLGTRGGLDSTPRPFLETSFDEHSAQISHDGRWVAYVSNESGRPEVYVRASDPGSAPRRKTPISTQGGFEPRWSRAGSEVCYRVLVR
jgi:Tol biopolymer transport system component